MKRALAWMCVCLALVPAAAYAQASITGVVKDTSGAVLPGVTVEVASPVLIEKVRSTVTDGSGAYQIIQLLPGTYSATFTLPGFNTTKRDGIELSGSFVATINVELRVGELAETITVTGETPLVDVRSANVQKVVGKEIVDNVPTGRLGINLAALQPGMMLGATGGAGSANQNLMTAQDVGGTAGDTFTDLSIHGGKPGEQRQTIGGVSAATTIRFGESLSSSPSFTAMQEMSVNTSGADASLAAGGVQINYVPRDGGNTFKGLFFFSGATNAMQATNYSTGTRDASGNCTPVESLFCRGLVTQPGALKNVYDVNPGFGGPIVKDKLWFFGTARWTAAENYIPNNYHNLNFTPGVTSPTLLNRTTARYVPDTSQDLLTTLGGGGRFWEQTLRLSWQATQKNKISIYYNNKKRESYDTPFINNAPESRAIRYFFPFSDQLVQWSSPMTNRLLLEAGFWRHQETWGNRRAPNDITDPLAVGITDNNPQNTTGFVQLIQNYHGRVGATDTASHNPNYRSNVNLSYVTGSHSFKTGFDLNGARRWSDVSSVVPYSLVVSTLANNGAGIGIPVPLSVTLRSDGCTDPLVRQVNGGLVGGMTSIQPYCPTPVLQKVPNEGGAFVQDRWTLNKLTISAGLRFDWFYSEIPTIHLGPSLLTPNRNYDVPGIKTTGYKDWTPKVAAAYDLFGNGRTALKVNYGKYVLGQALGGLATLGAYNVQLTSTRNWIDNDGDFVPDCDLTRNTNQSPTAAGIDNQVDTCAAAVGVNANFYDQVLRPAPAVQDEARYGWGKRPYSWETAVAAQHELSQGVSVTAGVFWRSFGNFLVTDNISGTARDYTPYSITPSLIPPAPASAGGESLPSDINTGTFYNINPGVAVNNVTGLSKHMFPGSDVYDKWFGYDLTANMRLQNGITLQGGLATGHQTTDFCDVQDPAKAGDRALVEMLNVAGVPTALNTCHMEQNWQTQIKFLGSYTIPKIDVQLGGSYQNIPGIEYAASYAAPNSDLARPVSQGGLGRLPTGGVATGITNVNIIQPGGTFGPRFNQIDLRLGKNIRMGSRRAVVSLDIFNVLNSDTISSASTTYSTWLAPQSVIAPRLFKGTVTFDF